jgi:membrane protein required for colicin V production
MPSALADFIGQIDLAIIALIVLSGLFGLWRGIVKEVFSIASLILAIVAVRLFSGLAALRLESIIDNGAARLAIASAILFISVMIVGGGLIALLQKLLTFTGLGLFDRLLGGVFGLARGVLVLMVFIYFAEPFVGTRQFWVESLSIARAQEVMAVAAEHLQPVAASRERGNLI